MGSKTKLTNKSLKDASIVSSNIATDAVTAPAIAGNAVTSAKLSDNTVAAGDLTSTLDLSSKTITLPTTSVTAAMLSSTLDLSSKTVTLPVSSLNTQNFNIALLGFKKAVSENLTVFNLVDGVVDEFADESGVDNSASTNAYYCGTDDYYTNLACAPYSAGFTTTSITEPDTSVTGTNSSFSSGTFGTFTVPAGMTSMNAYLWGAAGGGGHICSPEAPGWGNIGGGGGFSSGSVAVTSGQVLEVVVGEGGLDTYGQPGLPAPFPSTAGALGGGGGFGDIGKGARGLGGGGTFLINNDVGYTSAKSTGSPAAPNIFMAAGGGGGGGVNGGDYPISYYWGLARVQYASNGGGGGGLIGNAGGQATAQSSYTPHCGGGGGSQTAGGQSAPTTSTPVASGFLIGATTGTYPDDGGVGAGGGGGFYGGGGGGKIWRNPNPIGSDGPGYSGAPGGGGSSYYGHPSISSGTTENAGHSGIGGGVCSPLYVAGTNESPTASNTEYSPTGTSAPGEDGYVLLTGTGLATSSTTIISDPFTSTTVPTSTRIVVFEENVGTPSLNTDIIASVSRNGGTNFTTVTLTDSGYVTGLSGQRILTGQASVSGQPSGQSMKWKLELANQQVKIHGVSLSWA